MVPRRSSLGRGPVMVRRVDVGAGVRDGGDLLDGPTLAVGKNQVVGRDTEELLHLRQPLARVIDIMYRRWHGLAHGMMSQRHTEID